MRCLFVRQRKTAAIHTVAIAGMSNWRRPPISRRKEQKGMERSVQEERHFNFHSRTLWEVGVMETGLAAVLLLDQVQP